jgi:DNA-binding response OmpR family regulator
MKILEMGLAQSSVTAMMAEKHLVIPCTASNSDDLFDYIDCESPNVVVADIDSHSWLLSEIRTLRGREVRVPVVALVSPNCVSYRDRRAEFLEGGGNDLLEKPIHTREMLASMDSLSRLYSRSLLGGLVSLTIGSTTICADVARGRVSVDGTILALTHMEYKLLELLMLHKDQVVSKKNIQDCLYGFLDVPENNCIQVLMVRIRQKLTAISSDTEHVIQTVRRVGYRMTAEQP